MNDNQVNLLNDVKKQIERFDGKANILSAISGVLLGMSFSWVPLFKSISVSQTVIFRVLFIFIFLYIVFSCLALVIFIWSVVPRGTPKKIKKIKTLYYKDLEKMKPLNIKKQLLENQEIDLLERIQINSIIASKKHKMIFFGIIFLSLSLISLVVSIFLYVFI